MSVEQPPPYNRNNPDQWAEQLTDYLIRKFAQIQAELDDHEARIEALEAIVIP